MADCMRGLPHAPPSPPRFLGGPVAGASAASRGLQGVAWEGGALPRGDGAEGREVAGNEGRASEAGSECQQPTGKCPRAHGGGDWSKAQEDIKALRNEPNFRKRKLDSLHLSDSPRKRLSRAIPVSSGINLYNTGIKDTLHYIIIITTSKYNSSAQAGYKSNKY
jgi:hypothetical protein